MYNKERTPENKRDDELETILSILNNALIDDEKDLIQNYIKPKYPVLFIIGNARSGTTLLYQWLASTGIFAYPSNIISRFYEAPYIGALIHKVFVEYDKFGELLGDSNLTFDSNLGKTKGPISPHEFWYFWRRFFDFRELQKLNEEGLSQVDSDTFVKELAALEGAFNRPLILKGMILNWNIHYLKKIIPNAIFLHITRQGIFNMQSLYKARIKYFADAEKWYSFKPPEYIYLKDESIYDQLAGQVFLTNKAINEQLDGMKNSDYLKIEYQDLCCNPNIVFEGVKNLLEMQGMKIGDYSGPDRFESGNEFKVEGFDPNKAQKAFDKFLE